MSDRKMTHDDFDRLKWMVENGVMSRTEARIRLGLDNPEEKDK